MKTILSLLIPLGVLTTGGFAQIPVTDVANLANNTALHAENLAKWVESIAQLKTQIDQLRQQIEIQSDLRQWSGDPVEAGGKLILNGLGASDLVRDYGRTKDAILATVDSLDSLAHTESGTYRLIASLDLDGNEARRDPLTYRRYAVLDALQENTEQVSGETKEQEQALQEEIALTLEALRAAPTDAETQKLAGKLNALNGQLAHIEATRRREVDAVALQKIANDARREQERLAAAELAAKDDFLAQQRVSAYLATLKVRQNHEANP